MVKPFMGKQAEINLSYKHRKNFRRRGRVKTKISPVAWPAGGGEESGRAFVRTVRGYEEADQS